MKEKGFTDKEIEAQKLDAIQFFRKEYLLSFGDIYDNQMALLDDDFNFARECVIWKKVFDSFDGVSIAQGKKPSFKHLFMIYREFKKKRDKHNYKCDICENTGSVAVVTIEAIHNGVQRYILAWRKVQGQESLHFDFIRKFAKSERDIAKFYGARSMINCTCPLGDDNNTDTDEDGNKKERHSMINRQRAVDRRVPTVRLAKEIIRKIKFINEGREDEFIFKKDEELNDVEMEKIKDVASKVIL